LHAADLHLGGPAAAPDPELAPLAAGAPVRVAGRMQVYNGQRQMVLDAIEAAPDADPAQFMPRSPHDPDELWAELQKLVRSVRNQHLAKALKAFFGDADFRGRFRTAPAAKGAHHAYVHGLLEHTVSVGGLARLAADHYGRLNRDLLTAGALLHDVGKVREFSLGPPIDYTDEGRLEGHLVLGVRMLDRRLAQAGARVDAYYHCPHHPDQGVIPELTRTCDCRKPAPGMVLRAARELNLDLAASFMVGDKPSDAACGRAAGVVSILVGGASGGDAAPDHMAADLAQAVDWILGRAGEGGA
jgi:putative nucleotidyltransferase with HDIG domain